jgi:hypothetical protein
MKRTALYAGISVLLLCATVMLAAVETAAAASYAMVTITKMPDGITPRDITVKRGQKVIWFNEEATSCKIRITSKVGLACSVPDNFYADLFGYYESAPVPQSGLAGICFIEKGTYQYEVRRVVKGTEEVSTGRVIVE